jgi:hypothetical protein
MTKKKTIIAVAVVAVVVVGVAMFAGSGENLQGFIGQRSTMPTLTVELDSSSPSGSRTVAATDTVAIFKLCAKGGDVSVEGLAVKMESDGDFDSSWVRLFDQAGSFINEGLSKNVIHLYMGFAGYTRLGALTITPGACKAVNVTADTSALVKADAGSDDPVTVSVEKVFTVGNAVVSTAMPVRGNTLKY